VSLWAALFGLWPSKAPQRRGLALAGTLGLLLGVAAPASAAAPASLSEIEAEVMCPVCGTLLELSESPQAQRERVFVSRLIAEGKGKEEVKDALVAEYGSEVLALPGGSGFDLSAYLVPIVAFLIAAGALALGIVRWRRAGGPSDRGPPAAGGPSPRDAERLEADLARYDL
jgi:cytochrome c-type biogenesis protein CcmH